MRTASAGFILIAGLSLAAFPTRAHTASINDLKDSYNGVLHGNTQPALETVNISVNTSNRQSNGKFSAVFGPVSIPGKVSSSGKLTIKGKLNLEGGVTTINIKAQLSATGRFIVGTASLKGFLDGTPVNEKFTLNMEAGSVEPFSR